MKAKTLLMASAALAAGIITSQAQSGGVYSQNIVGYINVPIPSGYVMVANQLDLDGTGTNNTILTVVGTNSLPAGSQVLTWNGSSYNQDIFSTTKASKTVPVWGTPTLPLNIGEGFLVFNPGAPTNITEVGNVFTGTNVNPVLNGAGYYLVGSVSPIGGDLVSNLDYVAVQGDQALLFNNASTNFTQYIFSTTKASKTTPIWSPSVPQINVAQGFFIETTNTHPAWTEILNVQ